MQIESSKLRVYSNGEEASFYLERADLCKYMSIGDASGFNGRCTGPILNGTTIEGQGIRWAKSDKRSLSAF